MFENCRLWHSLGMTFSWSSLCSSYSLPASQVVIHSQSPVSLDCAHCSELFNPSSCSDLLHFPNGPSNWHLHSFCVLNLQCYHLARILFIRMNPSMASIQLLRNIHYSPYVVIGFRKEVHMAFYLKRQTGLSRSVEGLPWESCSERGSWT